MIEAQFKTLGTEIAKFNLSEQKDLSGLISKKIQQSKGFTILGAAKVLAVHSLMWQLESPLGKGRPDLKDERMVQELVNNIHKKLYRDNPKGIKLSELAYQSKAHQGRSRSRLLRALDNEEDGV